MELSKFNKEKEIFIDANIFTLHFSSHSDFGEICTQFSEKIESDFNEPFINFMLTKLGGG